MVADYGGPVPANLRMSYRDPLLLKPDWILVMHGLGWLEYKGYELYRGPMGDEIIEAIMELQVSILHFNQIIQEFGYRPYWLFASEPDMRRRQLMGYTGKQLRLYREYPAEFPQHPGYLHEMWETLCKMMAKVHRVVAESQKLTE